MIPRSATPPLLATFALGAWLLATTATGDPEPLQDPTTGQGTPPERLDPGSSCLDCHEELTEGAVVHEPAAEEMCAACHRQTSPDRHEFRELEDLSKACLTCHEAHEGEIVHAPVEEGLCNACHDPHHSERDYLLKGESDAQVCGVCHSDKTGRGAAHVHGPVALGMCTMCHQPHAADRESLLRVDKRETCLQCHEDMGERLEEYTFPHPPVEQDCTLCHDPHAGENAYQLAYPGRTLCLACHEPIALHLRRSKVVHGAVTSGDECLNCHQVHGSVLPKLQKGETIDVCLECHAESIPREGGKPTLAMGPKLQLPSLHGPIREGTCTACHDPHASDVFAVLRHSYPQRFYAPFRKDTYALCYQCHEARVFDEPETETLTGFRDGARNLHYLHVHKEKKGRTCRACHDTHASKLPKHITEKVPFGKWEYPVNFEKTETGGSCAPGCHQLKKYDRENPVGEQRSSVGMR